MSDRYLDYNKGSRSTRDDSRTHRDEHRDSRDRERKQTRSRSRSPARGHRRRQSPTPSNSRRYSPKYKGHSKSSNDWADSDEEVPAPPPPPRISKISIGFSKPKAPIKMNIGGQTKTTVDKKLPVASVFNDDDDDDEPEEMPAEARMRMRNIGRETPTSAGPNSFGKTKQGFCDAKKVFEKNLKHALETPDRASMLKLPQTIYKIQGPL